MSAHLLLISIGPVQDFISQARRTRDLWFGSHLLSELSRIAARSLVNDGAELIFPALSAGDPELEPCLTPLRNGQTPPQNIANKILAEIPAGLAPKQLAKQARQAVNDFLREEIADEVRRKCGELLADNVDAVWEEQISSFLEYNASWLPLKNYVETRQRVENALAGRKLLRDFTPWKHERGGVPKSSLDGGRETVLRAPRDRSPRLAKRYRIPNEEQLDAIGLIKRAGGDPQQFVPVINVALAPWIDLANRRAQSALENLKEACGKVGISRVVRRDLPWTRTFPYDASLLLPSRWRSVFDDLDSVNPIDRESWGRQNVQPLLDRLPAPSPYVACLVADGDHMGRAIDSLDNQQAHREFSRLLSGFASRAREIVELQYQGSLVYAGGDDVLGFVPLSNAAACAAALQESFTNALVGSFSSERSELRPTLSVGLGIGHAMESMSELLALGRQAEREAKKQRNSLAVVFDKRSGGTRVWSSQWSDNPLDQLNIASRWAEDLLSSKKIYEIDTILKRLPLSAGEQDSHWRNVLQLEIRRALLRVEGGAVRPDEVGLDFSTSVRDYATARQFVAHWVARLLIAQALRQDGSTAPLRQENLG